MLNMHALISLSLVTWELPLLSRQRAVATQKKKYLTRKLNLFSFFKDKAGLRIILFADEKYHDNYTELLKPKVYINPIHKHLHRGLMVSIQVTSDFRT